MRIRYSSIVSYLWLLRYLARPRWICKGTLGVLPEPTFIAMERRIHMDVLAYIDLVVCTRVARIRMGRMGWETGRGIRLANACMLRYRLASRRIGGMGYSERWPEERTSDFMMEKRHGKVRTQSESLQNPFSYMSNSSGTPDIPRAPLLVGGKLEQHGDLLELVTACTYSPTFLI